MFRRSAAPAESGAAMPAVERITSVLGPGVIWRGSISGSGGVRIEGSFEGQIALRGLLVVGETGRVTCDNVRANAVIVAGAVRGNIIAQKLEIRASGRVWGDVTTTAFVTDEGAFLRGQIRMEETVELDLEPATAELSATESTAIPSQIPGIATPGARPTETAASVKGAGQSDPTQERGI